MNDTISLPAFLNSLRTATAASHTALEALPISESILKPDVTDLEYAHYLILMRDVVSDAEQNIFPILTSIIPDIESRNKTQHIKADLAALGAITEEAEKPLSESITDITVPFALGILYVIEGSSLGGRVILKNINTVLGHDAESGAAYFSGYGGQTGSRWKSFLEILVNFESENNNGTEIIAGANFAFDAIHKHFSANVR